MKRPHRIIWRIASKNDCTELLEAGVELPNGANTRVDEIVSFEISEDDPGWPRLEQYIRKGLETQAALATNQLTPAKPELPDRNSARTVDELISLEGQVRTDSLILALVQSIEQKAAREGASRLSPEEQIVLAVEALEREVNNGGYDQFFVNSPDSVPVIVEALQRIGCKMTARITEEAIKALCVSEITKAAVEAAMDLDDDVRQEKLSRCDDSYYKNLEPITDQLFAFIKRSRVNISL